MVSSGRAGLLRFAPLRSLLWKGCARLAYPRRGPKRFGVAVDAGRSVFKSLATSSFLKLHFARQPHEIFALLFLNAQHALSEFHSGLCCRHRDRSRGGGHRMDRYLRANKAAFSSPLLRDRRAPMSWHDAVCPSLRRPTKVVVDLLALGSISISFHQLRPLCLQGRTSALV